MATYARWNRTIQDGAGNALNATITVYKESDGLIATIYSDRAGATPKSNPFTLSSADQGYAYFHAVGGAYKVVATYGSYTQTWRYEPVGTGAEFDADSLSGVTAPTTTVPAAVQIAEATNSGSNYIQITVPAALGANYTVTLPAANVTFGTTGLALLAATDAPTARAAAGTSVFDRNRLINPTGFINQRSATSQADDTYAWDRHYVLTQTGAVGISTLVSVTSGVSGMMRMTQSQASAQRMGIAQIVEGLNCRDLRGQDVTLLGKVQLSASQTVRYAVLEWTGTSDTVTSDVVNDWTSGTYTAGNFFLGSNLTVTAVGSLALTANTLTDFLLKTTLGGATNNVIVLMWTEATAAQNVTLDLAWELIRGDHTGRTYPLAPREYGHELALCQRFYEYNADPYVASSFDSDTVSGVVSTANVSFKVQKRSSPTVTLSNNFNFNFGSTPGTPGAGVSGFSEQRTATGTANRGYFSSNWTADAEL